MLAFSVLTPYYNEEVIFSKQQLKEENEDGVTILFYLQRIFPGTVRKSYKLEFIICVSNSYMQFT
jgi:hypothetical protein